MSEQGLPPLPPDIEALVRQEPAPRLPAGFEEALRRRLVTSAIASAASGAAVAKFGFMACIATFVVGAAGGLAVGASLSSKTEAPAAVVAAPAAVVTPLVEWHRRRSSSRTCHRRRRQSRAQSGYVTSHSPKSGHCSNKPERP